MKKNIINICILSIITIIVLYFSLKGHFLEIMETIKNMNFLLFILSIFIFVGYIFLKSVVMKWIVRNFKEDYKGTQAFRMGLETNFFHAITPFSTGGQPYEVYRLAKDGVSVIHSANISVQNFIIYQTALVLLGIFALIYNHFMNLFEDIALLKNLVAIGFTMNFFVIVILFAICLFKKMNKIIINFLISILSKIKMIKNKETTQKKVEKYLSDFDEGARVLLQNKKRFIYLVFLELLALLLLYFIPYLLIKGVGIQENISIITVIVTSAYVMLIGSFVPIPGGTGGLEYGFIAFFGNFINGPILNALMLLWRFVTYYFGMILGAVILGLRKKE